MTLQIGKLIVNVHWGYTKHPLRCSKRDIFPTLHEAMYARGFDHGLTRDRAVSSKALMQVDDLKRKASIDHQNLKSAVGSLKTLIAELKKHVPEDIWLQVTQGKDAIKEKPEAEPPA